jgi:hypothetical protein
MPCDKYKQALIEAAANGGALSTLLRNHVDVCARCSKTLVAQQGLFAMMEQELRSRANLTVPSNFDHRVRAALQAQPSRERRRYLSAFTVGSVAAAAAVLLAILFTQTLTDRGRETPVNSVVEPKRVAPPFAPDLSGSLKPRSLRRVYSGGESALKRSHAVEAASERNTEPEVLVPRGQEELLAKYLEGIAARKTRVTFSADLQHEPNMKPVEVPTIEISALVVKPLSDLSSN